MKYAKKLTGLFLALVLSLSVTAFAAGGGNTITVTNAQGGETYRIYKLLDLEVNENKTAYAYTVNEKWTGFFTGSGDGDSYIAIDGLGYVTWAENKKEPDDRIAFGREAAAYAADAANGVPQAAASQTPAADGDITFEGLEPGYYIITSTNGTRVIVDTTPANPNPSIAEKNEDPTIEKTVEEGGGFGSANDAQIGQTVNFKTVVHAKSGAKNYVVHDAMSDGLDFDETTAAATAGGTALKGKSGETSLPYSTENTDGYHYEVITTGLADGCDFHLVFVPAYLDTITADTDITITYSAVLNEKAVVAGGGSTNSTRLAWGQSSETEWVTTRTYTWEASVLKYGNGDETEVLAGAQFILLNPARDKAAKFDDTGKITGWAALPAAVDGKIPLASWAPESIQTTGETGTIFIKGLDSGTTYYLREVKAPEGYNLLDGDQEVQIAAVEDTATHTMTQTALVKKVNNQSGSELPSTGGRGTAIFYGAGSILLVGAAVLLITKRRMNGEK